MKVKVLQEGLSEAFRTASRFTSSHVQLPVLSNILLSAKGNKLVISSTNLEMSSSIILGAQVEKEGDITVPAKVITELVINLPAGTILLEAEKEQLTISGENFKSTVSGMNSSDYPSVPQKIAKDASVLPGKDLISALSQVLFSVSVDETRPVLTGTLFVLNKKEGMMVATDGFRLSKKKINLISTESEEKIILPKNVLVELARLAESEDVKFEYRKEDKQVVFEVGNVIISSRVIEGEFPDFERIIPKTSTVKINLDKEEFLRAIKLSSVFARDSANVVKITVEKKWIEVSGESQLAGRGENKVDAKIESSSDEKEKLVVAFNYRFLEDFLNSITNEEIEISLIDSNSPGVFTDPKESNYLHLIMPVRIQA